MTDTGNNAKTQLIGALNGAVADALALHLKTKNFHWHVAGPHFRDLHLLFDEQAGQIIAIVDDIAERVRKNAGDTLTSVGALAKETRIKDQDDTALDAKAMLRELRDDNDTFRTRLIEVKDAAEAANDNATSGVVDDWIDQAEERIWFLTQAAA